MADYAIEFVTCAKGPWPGQKLALAAQGDRSTLPLRVVIDGMTYVGRYIGGVWYGNEFKAKSNVVVPKIAAWKQGNCRVPD